jgi:type IX secretion system PorP/SprF family membrane protein
MRKTIILVLGLTLGMVSYAQDPNFSQFFASPLTLNPALTGKFNGAFRVAGNYRNQWPSINNAFTTATLSFDMNLLRNRIPEFDQFGFGLMAFSDKSGNGVLQNNFLAASASYHKALDENGDHTIGLGFQGTYVSKYLDRRGLNFEDMLRSNGFTGLSEETFSGMEINVSYFDMNVGLLYTGTSDGMNNFYFGASMYHVNRPKESFKSGQYLLEQRVTLQAGGMLPLANSNALHFSAIHSRQANAINTVIGGAYMLSVNQDIDNPTNLFLGSWYRVGDAVIPYVGLEFGSFQLGATYDVNISSLKPASNMMGGAEISLIYTRKHSDPNAKKLNCPRF